MQVQTYAYPGEILQVSRMHMQHIDELCILVAFIASIVE